MDNLEELQKKIDKLQAFKDYVHQRLDDAGIEKYPNGEHSKHGCRIGDRLDIIIGQNAVNVNPPRSDSWLENAFFIDENSEIDGFLIKHNGGAAWGSVAVKSFVGDFAVIAEQQDEAIKRIGSRVKVKPDKDKYYCVSILEYFD